MSEPEGGAIDVRTRKKVIGVRARRRVIGVQIKRRTYRSQKQVKVLYSCQNQVEEL